MAIVPALGMHADLWFPSSHLRAIRAPASVIRIGAMIVVLIPTHATAVPLSSTPIATRAVRVPGPNLVSRAGVLPIAASPVANPAMTRAAAPRFAVVPRFSRPIVAGAARARAPVRAADVRAPVRALAVRARAPVSAARR